MPRMKVLNSIEQEAFEFPPVFNSAERKRHFDFPVAILQIAAELRTPANQLCFLLSCGYFRATHRFYPVQIFRPLCVALCRGRVQTVYDFAEKSRPSLRFN